MIEDVVLNDTYDIEFQKKIFASILTDIDFSRKILPILDVQYITEPSLQWLLKKIHFYFIKYKTVPNFAFFKNELVKDDIQSIKKHVSIILKDIKSYFNSSDLSYIKDEIHQFCVDSKMRIAVLESIDLIERKQYEKVRVKMNEALLAGTPSEDGMNYKEDIHSRYKEDGMSYVKTRWKSFNDNLGGGLPNGSLTVIIGSSGGGKSWLLCDIGQFAAMSGLNVAHYTLELSSEYTGRRYDKITTRSTDDEMLNTMRLADDDEDKISFIETIKSIQGDVDIKYYAPNYGTISMIRSHIEYKIQKNVRPDIIIIDYPDLLRSEGTDGTVNLDLIYKGCKAIAMDYFVPVVVVTQSNREGMKTDIIKETHISDDINKLRIADIFVSWNRTDDERDYGRMWWIKNRYGKDKILVEYSSDFDRGIILDGEQIDTKSYSNNINDIKREVKTKFNIGKSVMKQVNNY